ncbi:MAG: hypothetical protein U1B80_05800 [Anaerolineaceae bacterium]|nr:hypothetical protein [Anaerolineaceae bacterium]
MSGTLPESVWLALVLIILLVVVGNLVLLFFQRAEKTRRQIETLRKLVQNIRSPWQKEDKIGLPEPTHPLAHQRNSIDDQCKQTGDAGNSDQPAP